MQALSPSAGGDQMQGMQAKINNTEASLVLPAQRSDVSSFVFCLQLICNL
jgi:hypothetical protein